MIVTKSLKYPLFLTDLASNSRSSTAPLPTVPLSVKSSGSGFQPSALPKTDYDPMGMSLAETNTKSSFGSAYDANTTTITFKSY